MGMAEDVISDLRGRIGKTLDDLRRDLAKVRTGRANPQLLDSVRVDYYGTPTPLNQVANVTVADPRLIVIKPWEKSMIQTIEKAINAAGLGINALPDAEVVRVPIPALTEERRKEFVKIVKQKGDLAEDEGKKALAAVQAEVDAGIKKVDDTIAGKEKDLMQV